MKVTGCKCQPFRFVSLLGGLSFLFFPDRLICQSVRTHLSLRAMEFGRKIGSFSESSPSVFPFLVPLQVFEKESRPSANCFCALFGDIVWSRIGETKI